MDEIKQPEQRLGDEPQPTVVNGQLQSRRDGRQPVLNLWSDVELRGCGGGGLRRDFKPWAGKTHDGVAVVGCGAHLVQIRVCRVGDPGSDKVVLHHGDPATFDALVQRRLADVLEVDLLVLFIRCVECRTKVGADSKTGVLRGRVWTHVALELRKEVCLPGRVPLVVDAVFHADEVAVASKPKPLLDVHPFGAGVGERNHQFLLSRSELVVGR